MGGPEKPLLTDRKLHLELGFVAADTPEITRIGGSVEIGDCDRKGVACFDVGAGLQVTGGSRDEAYLTPTLLHARSQEVLTVAPFLRLGALFHTAKLISLGPVLRLGPATNVTNVDTARIEGEKPSASGGLLVNTGLFLMTGLRLLLSGEKYGVTMDVGLAQHPGLPNEKDELPASFGVFYQNSMLFRF